MSTHRVYIIKSSGQLVQASRGTKSYNAETCIKVTENLIGGTRIGYNRHDITWRPLGTPDSQYRSGYGDHDVTFFVATSEAAESNFLQIVRIIDAKLADVVFHVVHHGGKRTAHKTLSGACEAASSIANITLMPLAD